MFRAKTKKKVDLIHGMDDLNSRLRREKNIPMMIEEEDLDLGKVGRDAPPLDLEEEFLRDFKIITFFDIQLYAIRWMYDIERTQRHIIFGNVEWGIKSENGQDVSKLIRSVTSVFCRGGILGDEMGLGKTIDCLGLVTYDRYMMEKRRQLVIEKQKSAHLNRKLFSNLNNKKKKPNKQKSNETEMDCNGDGVLINDVSNFFQQSPSNKLFDEEQKSIIDEYSESMDTLVVTTLTLLDHWRVDAMEKFGFSAEDIIIYHQPKRNTMYLNAMEMVRKPFLYITTYDVIQKDFENPSESPIFKKLWHRVLIDEAHIARNSRTSTYKALCEINSFIKWCVTGTPIVNYTTDICVLSQICTPLDPLQENNKVQQNIWKKTFLLRRTKSEINLPEITHTDIWLDLDKEEQENYDDIKKCTQLTMDQEMVSSDDQDETKLTRKPKFSRRADKKKQKLIHMIMKMRQACGYRDMCWNYRSYIKSHFKFDEPIKKKYIPKQIEYNTDDNDSEICSADGSPSNPDTDVDFEEDEVDDLRPRKMISDSGFVFENIKPWNGEISEFEPSTKIKKMMDMWKEIQKNDPSAKAVVFSHFTTVLDRVQIAARQYNFPCVRFDGTIQNHIKRQKIVKLFARDEDCSLILISIKAGGVGLNITCANHVFLMDPWWNLSSECQAFDRVHRIGQTKPVFVYRLLIRNSIEEGVVKIQEKKREEETYFFTQRGDENSLIISELKSILK